MKVLDFRNMQTIEEWLKEQETDPDIMAMYEHRNRDYDDNVIINQKGNRNELSTSH